MILNKYYLSEFAKNCLFDRKNTLLNPKLYLIADLITSEQMIDKGYSKLSDFSIIDSSLPIKLIKLLDSIIFEFECDESILDSQHNGAIIGFDVCKYDGIPESEVMILLDYNNLYGGIIPRDPISGGSIYGPVELIEKRKEESQLKIGLNSFIIDNIFRCNFIFDENMTNNMSSYLVLNGSKEPLNSKNQCKIVYPYYKDI